MVEAVVGILQPLHLLDDAEHGVFFVHRRFHRMAQTPADLTGKQAVSRRFQADCARHCSGRFHTPFRCRQPLQGGFLSDGGGGHLLHSVFQQLLPVGQITGIDPAFAQGGGVLADTARLFEKAVAQPVSLHLQARQFPLLCAGGRAAFAHFLTQHLLLPLVVAECLLGFGQLLFQAGIGRQLFFRALQLFQLFVGLVQGSGQTCAVGAHALHGRACLVGGLDDNLLYQIHNLSRRSLRCTNTMICRPHRPVSKAWSGWPLLPLR